MPHQSPHQARSAHHRRRAVSALSLLLVLACAAVTYVAMTQTSMGRRLELSTVDARFNVRGQDGPAPTSVAVVAINDETDHRLHSRFPYPRGVYADAIEILRGAGARSVVFDVNFDFASNDPSEDQALVEAARVNPPVVFVTAPQQLDHGEVLPAAPLQELTYPGVAPGTAFARSRATYGLATVDPDVDGQVRGWHVRVPIVERGGTRTQKPSLVLAALRASGYPETKLAALPDEVLLDFPVKHSRVPHLNLADVIAKRHLERVRGRTVFIGATSEVLHDVHQTPFDDALPGVLLHASAFETLRAESWLERAPSWFGPVLAALLVIAWIACLTNLPLLWGLLTALGVTAGYVALTLVAFSSWLLELPVAAPVFAALTGGFALLARAALAALGERRRIAAMFARYVEPDLVRELVRSGGASNLMARSRREVTVLFADIRGFTAMSEHADPDAIVTQLNEYLSCMTHAIHGAGGTIDKFIGDGIMALFGAPLEQPDHADRACEAAAAMLEELDGLNERRAAAGLPRFRIGIGISTGTAIVGSIGSDQRLDYTAIGDCVNLAARLEGLTERLLTPVIMSEVTAQATGRAETRSLGTYQVRGRLAPTPVATLANVASLEPDFIVDVA